VTAPPRSVQERAYGVNAQRRISMLVAEVVMLQAAERAHERQARVRAGLLSEAELQRLVARRLPHR